MQVVLEEGHKRKIIFSTFDPDCATLLSLKCARCGPVLLSSTQSQRSTEYTRARLHLHLQRLVRTRCRFPSEPPEYERTSKGL